MMDEKTIRRPGPGWKWLAGSVWEHVSGVRIHIGGRIARLADRRIICTHSAEDFNNQGRIIREQGGNVKRGLMVWALRLLVESKNINL
jgi:hypothetical protein